ncbi:MAG TPA: hypothetical protein P5248_03575, partial [Bacteroidales bacterium]|nr:hypothetical protein [Bacteroidales bacterium]
RMSPEEVQKDLLRYLAYFSQQGHLVRASNWEEKFSRSEISREVQIEVLSKAMLFHIDKLLGRS